MNNVFYDNVFGINQYECSDNNPVETILELRENAIQDKRFFLNYLNQEKLLEYDFNNPKSVLKFQKENLKINKPLKHMIGYNMNPGYLKDDIRYFGFKVSDPDEKIYGTFDIRFGRITYCPMFGYFFDDRDLDKFARDTYFTTITFEEIMKRQIDKNKEFYVLLGYYKTLKEIQKYGKYELMKVSKDQMIEYITNPEEGIKVYQKSFKR